MVKKSTLLFTAAILMSSCTREVYLQSVPCVEGDCGCQCFTESGECCPETEMLKETIRYQVIDSPVVPVAPVTYTPCYTVPYTPSCTVTYTPRKITTTTTTTTTTTNSCSTCSEVSN